MRVYIDLNDPSEGGRLSASVVDAETGIVVATVEAHRLCATADFHAAMRALDSGYDPDDFGHGGPPNPPGYPGPCPDGMDWSEWLARNNVD